MKRLDGVALMRFVGRALSDGGDSIIRTQTPSAVHARIGRLARGWKLAANRTDDVWSLVQESGAKCRIHVLREASR